jgi:hypothetical protein
MLALREDIEAEAERARLTMQWLEERARCACKTPVFARWYCAVPWCARCQQLREDTPGGMGTDGPQPRRDRP